MEKLLEDKHCTFIHEDGPKAGQRCEAWRINNSTFCTYHGDNMERQLEARRRNAVRRKEIAEDLEFGDFTLRSIEDCQIFTEKVVKGILSGFLKRDKAGLIAVLLPNLIKMAKETKQPQGNILSLTQKKNITLRFESPEQMDAFLKGDDRAASNIIKDAEKEGRLSINQGPGIIDITARELPDLEDMKIPVKQIAKLTTKTDIPLKESEVIDLFGEVLADTKGAGVRPVPIDPTGFDHAFTTDGMPIEAQPVEHSWKKFYDNRDGIAFVRYLCEWCGEIVAHRKTEVCEKAPPKTLEDK